MSREKKGSRNPGEGQMSLMCPTQDLHCIFDFYATVPGFCARAICPSIPTDTFPGHHPRRRKYAQFADTPGTPSSLMGCSLW